MVAVAWTTMHHEEASPMAHVRALGMDLAQPMFPIVGLDDGSVAIFI